MSEPLNASALTWVAAEAVRNFNHVTLRAPGAALELPGDAYASVAGFKTAAQGLPQALAQLQRFLDALERREQLRHDSGSEDQLSAALGLFHHAADQAAAAAEQLANALNVAHSALSPIGYRDGDAA
jgi:hypothetical protein